MNNIGRIYRIIQSVSSSLEKEDYFASLTNSLILIDICSKISFLTKKNNERYKQWIDNFFLSELKDLNNQKDYLSSSNIYFLRTAMLHQGSADPNTNDYYQKYGEKKVRDIVPTVFLKENTLKVMVVDQGEEYPTLFFDIHYFCNSILNLASKWIVENRELVEESDLRLFSIAYEVNNSGTKSRIIRM